MPPSWCGAARADAGVQVGRAAASMGVVLRSHDENSGVPSDGDLRIGKGVRIVGSVHAPAGVEVLGTVEGDLDGRTVVIGGSGIVRGSLRAKVADIHGEISQDAEVSDSLILRKSSRLTGELRYRTIEIEAGARLSCTLRLLDEGAAPTDAGRSEGESRRPTTGESPGPSSLTGPSAKAGKSNEKDA